VRGGTIGAATPIQLGAEGGAEAVGEKMTSYVRGVFRATAEAKKRDPVLAEAMVDASISVPGLAPTGKLLTATANEALDWGLVDVLVEGRAGLLERTGLGTARIEARETGWAERLARVLTDPVLSGMLMSFGFLGLLMEFYTPGFGVIGAIGLTCLGLFFFGHSVVHLAGMEELLLFAVGLVLLGVELFVTPGFGLLGILGLAGIAASLVMALKRRWETVSM
jgi:membrane-bound serine protease (ClpP class)